MEFVVYRAVFCVADAVVYRDLNFGNTPVFPFGHYNHVTMGGNVVA